MEENNQGQQNVQYNQNQTVQTKKLNALCLASFICSLAGLLIAGIPLGIAAIITGGMGVAKFQNGTESGKWMGIFGIILGAVDIIAVIVFLTTMSSTVNNLNNLTRLYR